MIPEIKTEGELRVLQSRNSEELILEEKALRKKVEETNDLLRSLSKSNTPMTKIKNWAEFFGSLSEEQLEAVALLRVIECTNGCIQHTFRAKHPKSLNVEQTRGAMKYSMAAMKDLAFKIGDTRYNFSGQVAEGLREARELYVRAFKQGDEGAMDEFMDCSIACAQALGEVRILAAGAKVRGELTGVFPENTVSWGESYLLRLLSDDG